ncbi:MAG: carbohydrate kinase family protein [Chloroflexi bacterium]|nr:carbohydrate kinase family protein [Chloroflexota bacterium]
MPTNKQLQVVGLGALNMDHIYRVPKILGDGEAPIEASGSYAGGSAANTIFALARLGAVTLFIGAVGDDPEGENVRQQMAEAGVSTSGIVVKPGATGRAVILTEAGGRRAIYLSPGANALLSWADIPLGLVNRSQYLHLSSFLGEQQRQAQQRLVAEMAPGVKLSFAPGSVYSALGWKGIEVFLKRSHVVFLNASELHQLTGREVPSGARHCHELGCETVVVTFGKGETLTARPGLFLDCYVSQAGREYFVPQPQLATTTLDTTGAGDAFAAGFLYGLLEGHDPETCARVGGIMARFAIAELGARTSLPTADQLAARYRQVFGKPLAQPEKAPA